MRERKIWLGRLPCCGKAAQPETLGRLTGRAGREVDDLSAQLFGSPLFVGQRKIYRNVKLNHFRHHILLAGSPTPSGILKEPPQNLYLIKLISACLSLSISRSKLIATYKNTETKRELLAGMREKTQVW